MSRNRSPKLFIGFQEYSYLSFNFVWVSGLCRTERPVYVGSKIMPPNRCRKIERAFFYNLSYSFHYSSDGCESYSTAKFQ